MCSSPNDVMPACLTEIQHAVKVVGALFSNDETSNHRLSACECGRCRRESHTSILDSRKSDNDAHLPVRAIGQEL